MTEKRKRELKKLLKELKKIKGRHTELVSLYIPAGSNLADVVNQVRSEQATAENIKSKQTRKNVVAALEKMLQYLKQFREVPKNGLVLFCGNVSPVEGKEDIRLWAIEPPEPLKTKIYWCDQEFVLEPLEEMVEEKETYGLIVLDGSEANIGLIKGKQIKLLRHIESNVPGKTSKGGWSQQRYQRIREQAIHDFLKKVGEQASQLFLGQKNLKGIIIGGPGPLKEEFADGDFLHYTLKKKVLGIKDTSYANEYGLEELVRRSEDLIKQAAIMKEKEILTKFFTELQKEGLAIYGYERVKEALERGAVDTLLISEDFDMVRVKLKCQCGVEDERDVKKEEMLNQVCKNCGAKMQILKKEDLAEILEEEAANYGTKVFIVSVETQEGIQFRNFGIGAILRYKI